MALSRIQRATAAFQATVTSIPVSFASLPDAGRTVIVICHKYTGVYSAGDVVDNQGNTYLLAESSGSPLNSAVFYAPNIGAPSGTFTVTMNFPSLNNGWFTIEEWDGFGAGPSAVTVANNNGFSSTGSTGSTASVVVDTEALAIVAENDQQAGAATINSVSPAWDLIAEDRSGSPFGALASGYERLITASGVQSASWTFTGTTSFGACIVVFAPPPAVTERNFLTGNAHTVANGATDALIAGDGGTVDGVARVGLFALDEDPHTVSVENTFEVWADHINLNGPLTLSNNSIQYNEMQDISAASRLLGRGSAGGAGDPEEITLGSGLSMAGTTLSATGAGTLDDLSDVVITTPTDGDLLTYDSGSGDWINAPAPASGVGTSTGAEGSEPGSPTTGDLYFPNNGVYLKRYSGSVWTPWGPIFPFTEPVSGDFAWINQGGASIDTTNGGVHLRAPVNSGISLRIRKKAAPGGAYTVTAAILGTPVSASQSVGICFRQSSDGKLVIFLLNNNTLHVQKFTDATTFSASYTNQPISLATGVLFLRIADDNTNRICSFSPDGQHWYVLHTVTRTDFLTANEVGFFVEEHSNAVEGGLTLLSWKEA